MNSIFFIWFYTFFAFAGWRETAAKFRPQDLPCIEEGLKAIRSLNPKIFDKVPDKVEFDANIFVSRVMQQKKTGTPVQLATITRHEDLQTIDNWNFSSRPLIFYLIATMDFERMKIAMDFFLVFDFYIQTFLVCLYFWKKCTDIVDCSLTSVKK